MMHNPLSNSNQDLIVVGKILAPYALKGMVKVVSYMQDPKDIFKMQLVTLIDNEVKNIVIKSNKAINDTNFICAIENVTNRDESEKITKLELFIHKSTLPILNNDEFYVADLKNKLVIDKNGEEIGVVNDIFNFGANDIIEIKFNNGKTEMYAFNQENFPKIEEKITFAPPKIL
jgi:16S rRNA processing protein RimM